MKKNCVEVLRENIEKKINAIFLFLSSQNVTKRRFLHFCYKYDKSYYTVLEGGKFEIIIAQKILYNIKIYCSGIFLNPFSITCRKY